MNPDGYTFVAFCEVCQKQRSVSCSVKDLDNGKPVTVASVMCGHNWTLTPELTAKVRESRLEPEA